GGAAPGRRRGRGPGRGAPGGAAGGPLPGGGGAAVGRRRRRPRLCGQRREPPRGAGRHEARRTRRPRRHARPGAPRPGAVVAAGDRAGRRLRLRHRGAARRAADAHLRPGLRAGRLGRAGPARLGPLPPGALPGGHRARRHGRVPGRGEDRLRTPVAEIVVTQGEADLSRPGYVLEVDRSTPPVLFHHGEGFSLERLPVGSRVIYPPEPVKAPPDPDAALRRRMTAPALNHAVGRRVFDAFAPHGLLYNHDAEDPDGMELIGHTDEGERVEINKRAATSDLLVYVNINLVAMDGGHKS